MATPITSFSPSGIFTSMDQAFDEAKAPSGVLDTANPPKGDYTATFVDPNGKPIVDAASGYSFDPINGVVVHAKTNAMKHPDKADDAQFSQFYIVPNLGWVAYSEDRKYVQVIRIAPGPKIEEEKKEDSKSDMPIVQNFYSKGVDAAEEKKPDPKPDTSILMVEVGINVAMTEDSVMKSYPSFSQAGLDAYHIFAVGACSAKPAEEKK